MFKKYLKSIGIIGYYFIAQILGMLGVLIYKAVFDLDWYYFIVELLDKEGALSLSYLSEVGKVIYPSLLISDILLLVPFLIYIKKNNKKLISKIDTLEFFDIFCLGIVLNILISFLVSLVPSSISSEYNNMMSMVLGSNFIVVLIMTGILAPIIEELMFRYAIINIMLSKGKVYAVVVSSILFGAAHLNLIQSTYAFVLGLVLGYLYIKKFNLLHSIIFHVVVNSSSVIYEYYPYKFFLVFGCLCLLFLIIRKGGTLYEKK